MRLESRVRRGRRSVGLPRLLDAAAQELRVFRLADDDLRAGHLLREDPRHAFQRSARPVSGHPVVELLALEVGEQLACGGVLVDGGVGGGLELPRVEPPVGLGQFLGLARPL